MNIKQNITDRFDKTTVESLYSQLENIKNNLHNGIGEGSEFTGWLHLPSEIGESEIQEIEQTAEKFKKTDAVVIVGIGGSYLGAKAVISALQKPFSQQDKPEIIFAGNHISDTYLYHLLNYLENKNFGIVVISKSGTTLEPALAFRLLRNLLNKQKGEKASEYIVAITDKEKGALKKLADKENFKTFVIPDNVGGRFSVLTPVGLLPISIAGFDIKKLISGAKNMEEKLSLKTNIKDDIAIEYALVRNLLYQNGKKIEIMANYTPELKYFAEWWKQLYGESEGKNHKGIFPASVNFTTDLHSLGQYIQDGERILFETVLNIKNTNTKLEVPFDNDNLDGLNYLAEKQVDFVNKQAMTGTIKAHESGNVPNIVIDIDSLNEQNIGELIYFFEKACAYSAYLLGVNPFNQPGVEDYKRNMYELLKK